MADGSSGQGTLSGDMTGGSAFKIMSKPAALLLSFGVCKRRGARARHDCMSQSEPQATSGFGESLWIRKHSSTQTVLTPER
jgi:hypothetical protein